MRHCTMLSTLPEYFIVGFYPNDRAPSLTEYARRFNHLQSRHGTIGEMNNHNEQLDCIVLATKAIVEREKQVSRAEIKEVDVSLSGDITLSETETTWAYKWQEFKFATPLKETNSDDWYICWVVAKKFSSGSEGTPIGEWVSGAATKGDRILEKNF